MKKVPDTFSVASAVAEAVERLDSAGVTDAKREAELLLAYLLGGDRGAIVARRPDPLEPHVARCYQELLQRRERREPIQYITGQQEFYGLEFAVDRRVLIPRPETEAVVDAILNLSLPEGANVADLGTGSGCIAIALAVSRTDLVLYALDRSAGALELARKNARRHGVEDRIEFRQGNLSQPPETWSRNMDAVGCNPPYVSEEEWLRLQPEVRDWEPRDALVAGPDGVEAYEALAPLALGLLRSGGRLVLELGQGQASKVSDLVKGVGFSEIRVLPDLRGIQRVLIAQEGQARKGS